MAFSYCLAFAARVWFFLIEFYAGWPYKAGRIVAETVPPAEQQATAEELCNAKDCCLDDGISLKVHWANNVARNRLVYNMFQMLCFAGVISRVCVCVRVCVSGTRAGGQ